MPAAAKTSSRGKKAAASGAGSSPVASTSTAGPLLDSHVSSGQALKAFKALQSHRQKHKSAVEERSKQSGKSVLPLDGGDEALSGAGRTADTVYLNIVLKRLDKKKQAKPVMVPLPHSIHDPKQDTVCLIVKDPQRTYKDLLPTLGVSCVHRIVGVSKLKGKFAPFEARRQLMNDYDLFLCDDRVGPLMPTLLGKKWMESKKMPMSVNVVRTKHLKKELDTAVGATKFTSNRGTQISMAIGSASRHSADELVENLKEALPRVMKKVPYGGWDNVQSLDLKTGKSASLPIWNADLKDRWVGVPDKVSDDEDEDSEEEAEEVEIPAPAAPTKAPAATSKKTKSSTSASAKAQGMGGADGVKKAAKVDAAAKSKKSRKSA